MINLMPKARPALAMLLRNGPVAVVAWATIGTFGCVFGPMRQVQMGPLGRYQSTQTIRVEVSGDAPDEVKRTVAENTQRALIAKTGLATGASGDAAFRLEVHVDSWVAAPASHGAYDSTLSQARGLFGLASASEGKLALDAALYAPGAAHPAGTARWESAGDPPALAENAGAGLGETVGRLMAKRRRDFVQRRAADERLLLTPTPLTMEPGEFAITDDELLLARLAVGISRHLQLDLIAGGLPIPGAAGGASGERAIYAGGAAGVAVIGFFDLGLKSSLLHETDVLPGFAVSYDMLDLFAMAGGAIVFAGDGADGAGYGVMGANAQFNLFTFTAGKHFGDAQVTAGLWVLDNHHFLPQSAGFQSGCVVAQKNSSGTTVAGGLDCASGSAPISHLPLQLRSFFGAEYVFGPHFSLMAEVLPSAHLSTSFVTTGMRVLLGFNRPRGTLALDRIKFRFDLGIIWEYLPDSRDSKTGAIPWAGIGLYFL